LGKTLEDLGYYFVAAALYFVTSYLIFFVIAVIEGSEVNICDTKFRDFLQDLKSDINHMVSMSVDGPS
jgi:hypothetical protein